MTYKRVNLLLLHGVNVINAGDLGIIHATVYRLLEEMPGARVTILSPFKNFVEHQSKNYEFSRKVDVRNWGATEVADFFEIPFDSAGKKIGFAVTFVSLLFLAILDRLLFNYRLSRKHAVLKHYAAADVIISKGGGFLHDKTGAFGIPPHIFSMLLGLCYDAPLVIYAQSVGPFGRKLGKIFTRFVLDRAKLLLIREKESIDYVRNDLKVKNKNLYLTADEAFLLEPANESRIDEIIDEIGVGGHRPVVGFALCNWDFPDSTDPVARKKRYVDEIAKTMESLVDKYDAQCLIVCHVEVDGVSDDRAVSVEVMSRIGESENVHLLGCYDDAEIKGILARCDLFIGTRMHSNIFALGGGVPTIAVSYLHKTEGIMRGLGLEGWVIPIDDFAAATALGMADRIIAKNELTRESVRKQVAEIQEKARLNAVKVRELIQS